MAAIIQMRGMDIHMKIVIASDSSGINLKNAVKEYLLKSGYSVEDVGQINEADTPMPYYVAGTNLAKAMQSGKYDRGITMCGSGAGVAMVVSKFKGVYCVLCESVFTAEKCVGINNANVLAMGQKVVSVDMACDMVQSWLNSEWGNFTPPERQKNVQDGFNAILAIEEENYK